MTTTDRQPLLAAAIQSVLAMSFSDYELIISDNFSQPSAESIVSAFDDPRIRYLRTDRRLAMTDHWEFAWRHVGGDYVIYLGDDNALHPDILKFADQAIAQHDLELLTWRCCSYYHPDWNIAYANLPSRGNVLTFEPGTTGRLYRVDASKILKTYCDELRLPGCFPGMINCLFSRERAEDIRRRTERVFWPLAPDVAISYFLLGTIRTDRLALLDAYGAIGGRSRDSNLAAFLSRGKRSRRADELFNEYEGTDYFPHHPVKFRSMSNIFAATISQALATMPEQFSSYRYSPKTLAIRTLDDIYTLKITPWADDPRFLEQVETFLRSLPRNVQNEVFAYRDRCLQVSTGSEPAAGEPTAAPDCRRLWTVDSSYYVDVGSFGARDIADAARQLPRILQLMDRESDRFVVRSRALGHVAEELSCAAPWWRDPRVSAGIEGQVSG